MPRSSDSCSGLPVLLGVKPRRLFPRSPAPATAAALPASQPHLMPSAGRQPPEPGNEIPASRTLENLSAAPELTPQHRDCHQPARGQRCPACHPPSPRSTVAPRDTLSPMTCRPSRCPALSWPLLPRKPCPCPEFWESRSCPARPNSQDRLGAGASRPALPRAPCGHSLPARCQAQHQPASGERHEGVETEVLQADGERISPGRGSARGEETSPAQLPASGLASPA